MATRLMNLPLTCTKRVLILDFHMPIPEFLRRFFQKPVAILGNGVSGQAAAELLSRLSVAYEMFDAKGTPFSHAEHFDLVIYSPSFVKTHPWRRLAKQAGCLCLGEIDFASLFWPGKIIAITGTNGKTTLTEFLAFALNRMGQRAFAVGNNGDAFCRIFRHNGIDAHCTAVCEVSSFQAESLHFLSPLASIWTNFAPDHKDVHGTLENYFKAKQRLMERTYGPTVVGKSVVDCAPKLDIQWSQVIDREAIHEEPIGEFNSYPQKENFFLAKALWEALKYPLKDFDEAAQTFQLPKHRLKKIATIHGVSFWNDSKSTNYTSLESALRNFKHPIVWIGGGKSKGEDLSAYVDLLVPYVKEAMLLGETGPELASLLKNRGIPAKVYPSLSELMPACQQFFENQVDVVLSPGFSSLDQFKNYAERGQVFEEAVQQHLKSSVR